MASLVARAAMRNVARDLRDRIALPVDTSAEDDARRAAERLRYALDPLAHLQAVEEWETDSGVRRIGHVFVPDTVTQEDVPLRPYAHQEAVIRAVVDIPLLQSTRRLVLRNVHVEKSRQMGLTWIFAWLWLWAISYHEIALGYSNMKAAEVDDGGNGSTIDSFFGKIRHLHVNLPPRFQAPLRFRGGNDPTISYQGRPRAFITGAGATPDPGRGGRYGGWLFDEAAFFPFGEQAHKALSRAVPRGLIYNSTPYGEGNVYFRLRDTRPANWTFERYHWTGHPVFGDGAHVAPDVADPERDMKEDPGPRTVSEALAENLKRQPSAEARKAAAACDLCVATAEGKRWTASEPLAHRFPGKLTSPWYDDAVLDLSDEQVASELDIDYTASLTARVYPRFSEEQHVVDRIPYDPDIHSVSMSIDYGLDVTAIAVFQETVRELRQIGELEIADVEPDAVVRELRRYLVSIGVPAKLLHETPQWLPAQMVIGDPAADNRELGTARSLSDTYRQAGLHIVAPPVSSVARTIVGVQRLLNGRPKRYIVSREACPKTIRHWKLNRWPVDRNGNRKAGATAPVDDEHNHMCFVAGTMITTSAGQVPIERMKVGDVVLTRDGWRPVIGAAATGLRSVVRVRFDGGELCGTPEHPVWIVGEGWRRLDEVGAGAADALLVVREVPDSDVAVVAQQATHYPCGGVMVNVQAAGSRIVSSSAGGLLADGADARLLGEEGVVLRGRDAVLRPQPVGAVAVATVGELAAPPSRAGGAAGRVRFGAGVVGAADRDTADFAFSRSGVLEHAAIVDVASDSSARVVVYNLEVAGTPEFFANGALVHNCRGIAYYVRLRWPVGEQDVRTATEKAQAAARDRAEAAQASAAVRGVRQGMRL